MRKGETKITAELGRAARERAFCRQNRPWENSPERCKNKTYTVFPRSASFMRRSLFGGVKPGKAKRKKMAKKSKNAENAISKYLEVLVLMASRIHGVRRISSVTVRNLRKYLRPCFQRIESRVQRKLFLTN